MTQKKATPPATAKKDNTTLTVIKEKESSPEQALAQTLLRPPVNAAATIQAFALSKNLDLMATVAELSAQTLKVRDGDLIRAEALLVSQAHSLDAIFNNLAQRSARNMGEYLDAADRYMRLALKAQAQCTRTLEVLATLKHPPVVIARQANIVHGPQQVNNGTA